MATLAQQVALSANKTFSARLTAAGATVALEVLVEPAEVRGNPLRRSLATGVLGSPGAYENRFATAVLTDDATYQSQVIGGSSTNPQPKVDADADAALLARLRAVWSALAGVSPVGEG
jgi:hypothetical protein